MSHQLEAGYQAHSDKQSYQPVEPNLVLDNLGLVGEQLSRLMPLIKSVGISPQDAFQVGTIGLIKTAAKYDPSSPYKFSTYAVPRIRGSILDLIKQETPVSRTMRARLTKIEAFESQFESDHGTKPNIDEIANATKLDPKAIEASKSLRSIAIRITPRDTDNGILPHTPITEAAETATDYLPEEAYLHKADQQEARGIVAELFKTLNKNEQEIALLLYFKNLSLVETAYLLGVSTSSLSLLRVKILKKLRSAAITAYPQYCKRFKSSEVENITYARAPKPKKRIELGKNQDAILTKAEDTVLALIEFGWSMTKIAARFRTSPSNVKKVRNSANEKLNKPDETSVQLNSKVS